MSEIILKPIPCSPNDDYMAGSDGRVYSRTQYAGFGKKKFVDWYPLKGHVTNKKYVSITLCHENKKVTKNIHRLICMAFHGLPPSPRDQVRHLDGNPQNNCPANLKWGNQIENWQDRIAHGHGMSGEKHHMSKLSDLERGHIRWVVERGIASRRHIARILGMSQAAITRIVSFTRIDKPENF